MNSLDAPGLARRKNRDGTYRYYWIATDCVRDTKGFEPPTVRLHYDTTEERATACLKFYSELMEWLNGTQPTKAVIRYTGVLSSLIDLYETHEDSPFHEVKPKTRANYVYELQVLKRRVGMRRLESLTGVDFRRWHKKFTKLAANDRHDGVRYAHGLMTMIRTVLKFGMELGIADAQRLSIVLHDMRFKSPKPRKTFLTVHHAQAIIEKAHAMGRGSIAIGQALQFELTLRQYDVTGRWEKVPESANESGIRSRGKLWRNGLTWNNIDENMILTITTAKNEVEAVFDLKLYPMVVSEIDRVPVDKRVGPIVLDEKTCRPYSNDRYARIWREVARAAGVPDTVWNRDSRAGGVTEATDAAGQDLEHVRAHAQHTNIETTQRYSRMTLEKTSNVAVLRVQHRKDRAP